MYSISTRLNSVFFYFVVGCAVLCVFNIATTITHEAAPTVNKFEVTKFTSLYDHPYTRVQHATGAMKMNLNFSPCFNWNSNLVFAWITATYKTGTNGVTTSVTVWDNIMLRKDQAAHKVSFTHKTFEYPIVDTYRSLANKELVFELHWEHMPVVGPILKHKISLGTYKLPSEKTKSPTRREMSREIDYENEF